MKKEEEKRFDELVGALLDPILVYSAPFHIPDWLKEQIKIERLFACAHREERATDAEVLAYLMPASLAFPLDSDWSNIFLYVSTKTLKRAGREVPADISVDSLSDYQERYMLDKLRTWIYEQRIKHRKDKRRKAA